jgi:hypothetical protein
LVEAIVNKYVEGDTLARCHIEQAHEIQDKVAVLIGLQCVASLREGVPP